MGNPIDRINQRDFSVLADQLLAISEETITDGKGLPCPNKTPEILNIVYGIASIVGSTDWPIHYKRGADEFRFEFKGRQLHWWKIEPGRTGYSIDIEAPESEPKWALEWGFASTGSKVGVIGEYATADEARAAREKWDAENDNPAAACWVVELC